MLKRSLSVPTSSRSGFVGRAADAASSVLIIRDQDGGHRLNTPYLLRVLTVAGAHIADRPYWRRSASQPLTDFGSTLGNDAGLNVLHQFEPGLLQLMKNHEPRFVSRIHDGSRRR